MSRLKPAATTGAAVVLAVGLAAGLSACGSGQPTLTGRDKTAAAHLSRAYQAQGFTAADANCLTTKWVGKVGSRTMVKDGLLDQNLVVTTKNSTKPSASLVQAYVDAYFSCVDYGHYEAVKFDHERPNTINDQQFAACANKIDKDKAKQAMADDLLQKDSTVSAQVNHDLISCITTR